MSRGNSAGEKWVCFQCKHAVIVNGRAVEVICYRHSHHPARVRGGVRMQRHSEERRP